MSYRVTLYPLVAEPVTHSSCPSVVSPHLPLSAQLKWNWNNCETKLFQNYFETVLRTV